MKSSPLNFVSSFYSIHENLIMRVVERDFVFNYLRNPALPRLLIVAPSTYPRMVLNNDFINFLTYFKLWISKPSLEYSYGSPKFPNRNSREISQGDPELWSDIQTNKDYYFKIIDARMFRKTWNFKDNNKIVFDYEFLIKV